MVIKINEDGFNSNSYIITADGEKCVIVDPSSAAVEKCTQNDYVVQAALLTHGHFDHVGGCAYLSSLGVPVYCSEQESGLIFSKEYLGIFGGVHVEKFEIAKTFSDGDELSLASIDFKVIKTPGHTKGSVCFITAEGIFTGDTIFCGGIGRWDLPTGDYEELFQSLKKLKNLQGDYKLFCGHGEDTFLSREREFNRYLKLC